MPPSRPLNPTVLFLAVGVVWALLQVVLSVSWVVSLLIAAVVVNALLWLHSRWARRRTVRRLDRSRPYSREDEIA